MSTFALSLVVKHCCLFLSDRLMIQTTEALVSSGPVLVLDRPCACKPLGLQFSQSRCPFPPYGSQILSCFVLVLLGPRFSYLFPSGSRFLFKPLQVSVPKLTSCLTSRVREPLLLPLLNNRAPFPEPVDRTEGFHILPPCQAA
jgi:hypothetical protein